MTVSEKGRESQEEVPPDTGEGPSQHVLGKPQATDQVVGIDIFLRTKPEARPSDKIIIKPTENQVVFQVPRAQYEGYTNHQRDNYEFFFTGIIGPDAQQDEVLGSLGNGMCSAVGLSSSQDIEGFQSFTTILANQHQAHSGDNPFRDLVSLGWQANHVLSCRVSFKSLQSVQAQHRSRRRLSMAVQNLLPKDAS